MVRKRTFTTSPWRIMWIWSGYSGCTVLLVSRKSRSVFESGSTGSFVTSGKVPAAALVHCTVSIMPG